MNEQFGRSAKLLLANETEALDLSKLRFTFRTTNNDTQTPNTAIIRAYNLSDQTSAKASREFQKVIIDAGYENNHAEIFNGTIRQLRRGQENNVDSFLEILAADTDLGINHTVVSKTFKKGVTVSQVVEHLADEMGVQVDASVDKALAANEDLSKTGGIFPRGKVLFGMARSNLSDIMRSAGARW